MFLTSSCTHSGGNLKRKRENSTDQNIWREEGASASKPKLKIIRSQNPSRPLISATENDLLQTKIPRIGAVISVTPIFGIPIQSVATAVRGPNEVRFTHEPSPATNVDKRWILLLFAL